MDVQDRLKRQPGLQVIDVREPEEYAAGHIPGAKLIPLGQLPQRLGEVDRTRDAVIVCRSGGRSGKACELLASKGYERIYNLMGGMLQWSGDVE
ncbi:MAG: rhodanese-like domain-containing protein [Firmicutes bacterium]|nr:rhodanese-like domain-containing protein [Bacillota bacterium]